MIPRLVISFTSHPTAAATTALRSLSTLARASAQQHQHHQHQHQQHHHSQDGAADPVQRTVARIVALPSALTTLQPATSSGNTSWLFHCLTDRTVIGDETSKPETPQQQQQQQATSAENLLSDNQAPASNAKVTIVQRISNAASDQWHEMETAPPESMRGRMYAIIQKLQSKVDPAELFFKDVSVRIHHARTHAHKHIPDVPEVFGQCDVVEILHPLQQPAEFGAIQHNLGSLATDYRKRLDRRMAMYVALVPLTAMMSVVPGPNIFLLWNALRLHSIIKARQGCAFLTDACAKNAKRRPSLLIIQSAQAPELADAALHVKTHAELLDAAATILLEPTLPVRLDRLQQRFSKLSLAKDANN
ncbi:hypothetical protein CAOG_05203 [Capsaspora owczarzaki ATCC 30864]|uniref:Uncharacterized protein n=1 Tax=Capsaspora owczarzaki (strain ATCC 30864) TaxID=595528 RepID=A0A0D2X3M6_CAPO3|nr:hypothetical protein CAOG_05203 [Capsaspora owczarzaki ATCC 30864]KJE94574.1 hypothetical protein CAOG_005203 [Capsaspora owczarzaki ATCC 30864]|eukprot:XP_004346888.1 hypothetical protein CAOG_05203 [Capsaspora owczarzaki ATCC 30864]